MAPTKVGFIGLSSNGWAKMAHFPMLKESDNYQIVAICNSSVESSQAAIKQYELPAGTKAYGKPEDLARDENVDLVVCSVRVDHHLSTISPSLKAGKDVYVEWPLGKNLSEAKELLKLKNEGKVKVATVGLQARQAPTIKTVKKLIADGKIGAVLSSTWTGQGVQGGKNTIEGYAYLSDKKVGGNLLTIHFGHAIDYIQSVLGYGFEATPKSLLANKRTTQVLHGANGEVINAKYPKTADDTIFLHGILQTGVPLSVSLRGGAPFAGEPGLDWRIYGEEGEIRITASGTFLQIGYPDVRVQLMEGEGEAKDVEIETDEFDEGDKFMLMSRNVARVYMGLSEGKNNCSFEDAVERHELLDAMYKENGYEA